MSQRSTARTGGIAHYGAFQVGDYDEIINKATCLSLLSNAVVVWNTVQMAQIIAQLRAQGETITDDELARISPLEIGRASCRERVYVLV